MPHLLAKVRVAYGDENPAVLCTSGVLTRGARGAWKRLVLFLQGNSRTAWTAQSAKRACCAVTNARPPISIGVVLIAANGWQYGRKPVAGANGEATFE